MSIGLSNYWTTSKSSNLVLFREGAAATYLCAAATYLSAAATYLCAAATYMMDFMKIRLSQPQLKLKLS